MGDTFAVILEQYEQIDPPLLADVFVDTLGLLRLDALQQASLGRGILVQHIDAGQAAAVAKRLSALDVACRVIPQSDVVTIGRSHPVRVVEIHDAALGIQWGYAGAAEPVPWENIFLVTAGEIAVVETHVVPAPRKRGAGFLAAALPIALGPGGMLLNRVAKMASAPTDTVPGCRTNVLDVHLADLMLLDAAGEYRQVRLKSRDLYYDRILGEEASREHFTDFCRVVGEIVLRAERAKVTPEAHAMLLHGHDDGVAREDSWFGDEVEFTQYNRWLLQMFTLANR